MSNVPKSKRKKHDFQTTKEMSRLRKDITELMVNNFGYREDKYQKGIDRALEKCTEDDTKRRECLQRMQDKHDYFYDTFIKFEVNRILHIWSMIVGEFQLGNSIFPYGKTRFMDFCERRKHFTNSICYLNALKYEIQYIGESLPFTNKDRYLNIGVRIEHLIAMVKGVRQASNKFIGGNKESNTNAQKVQNELS